ncbi:hypothetical protein M878_44785 [Streptomyces roseochromogenus subsp. oscitans DS 12.976]|uniref:Uncharacterized protein n=1 Tax=Streptomyces roseochromogenus subsp. oscitans DS 12.976 TaxID=1352936 RepID=V6JEU7_STRRC|nr:hypothetical protein M878_44785 [Streptomyces roseochromogenus subsp. oscitans DS 12.976]
MALSAGWSLDGNQVEAALGSQATKTPSSEPNTIGPLRGWGTRS